MAYTEDICVDCRDSDAFHRSPEILLSIVQCMVVLWLDLSHADRQYLIVYILCINDGVKKRDKQLFDYVKICERH